MICTLNLSRSSMEKILILRAIMTELLDLIIVHETYYFTTFHMKDNIRPPYGIM